MKKIVRINDQDIEVDLQDHVETNNCHCFTRAVILKLDDLEMLNGGLNQLVSDLRKTTDADSVRNVYNSVPGAVPFNLGNMSNIVNAPGLILFKCGALLQHSMLVVRKNVWQGANNGGSLGEKDDLVHEYCNMHKRFRKPGSKGGWDENDNNMYTLYNDLYTMYYIPLCAPWVDNDGCCLIS